MKRRVLAGVFVLLLLQPSTGSAIPILDWLREAINTVLLIAINVTQQLTRVEHEGTDAAQVGTYNRYRFIFANNASFRAIQATIAQVHGIRREIAAIACGWQFSPRTAQLRDLYLRPTRLCRPSFRLIWGSPVRTAGRDLEEMHDYVASLTANQLSARAEAEMTWTRVYPEVFRWTTTPGWSPGESNRVEAMMLAMTGQIALANNQVLNQKLLVDELEWDIDRRSERQATYLKMFALQALASPSASPAGSRR